MKKIIILQILDKLRQKPHLMRKVKILALIGGIGFIFTGALLIWAGISTVNFMASKANEVMQSHVAQQQFETLKAEAKSFPKIQALSCWEQANSLVAVEPWLARPALENLKNLKVACLEMQPVVCEGNDCTQMKKLMNTTEGETI